MAEGDDDMLTPEEESLIEAREFGKTDRLNKDVKQARLLVLNSPFPTREELQVQITGLQSSMGKGLLEMATYLHDELQGLVASEQADKVSKLRFNVSCDAEEDDAEEKKDTFETKAAQPGPQSTIGVLLADRPDVLGFPGRCIVHGCVPGSPAYFSNKIKPGDVLLQVDEEDVTPDNVVVRMRGNDVAGTRIKLIVDRVGRKRPFAVHLIRAPVESVAQKRAVFEKLAILAQAAGAVQEQDKESDDSSAALQKELIALMKLVEREKVEEEILLREQAESKGRALIRAQVLIQEFLSTGTKLLSADKPAGSEATVGLLPLPEGPNTSETPTIQGSDLETGESKPSPKGGSPIVVSPESSPKGGWFGTILRSSSRNSGTLDPGQAKLSSSDSLGELPGKNSDLESRIASLEAENVELKKKIAAATATPARPSAQANEGGVDTLGSDVSETLQVARDHATLLSAEMETLTSKLERTRNALARVESESAVKLSQAEQQLAEAEVRCTELLTANGVLSSSLEDAGATIKELQNEVRSRSQVVDSLHECRTIQDAVSVSLFSHSSLCCLVWFSTAHAENFLQARQASEKRCKALQERCDALQERCTSLSDRCDALGTQREHMLLTISNAQNDAAVALKLLEDEKSRNTDAQASFAELQEDLSKKEEMLTKRGKQVDEMTAQVSDLNEQAKEMEEQLMEQETLFKKGLASAQTALEEAKAERSELVEANRVLLTKLEQSLEVQQSDRDALKDALARYEDLNNDHSALILEHDTLRMEGEKVQEELHKKIVELEEQLKKQKQDQSLEKMSKAPEEEFANQGAQLEDQLKKIEAERSAMLKETERVKGAAQEQAELQVAGSEKPSPSKSRLRLDITKAESAPQAKASGSAPLKQGSPSATKIGQVTTQSRPLSGSAGVKVTPQSPSAQAARAAAQGSSASSSSSSSVVKPAQWTPAQHIPPPQPMPPQPYGGMPYMHKFQGGGMRR